MTKVDEMTIDRVLGVPNTHAKKPEVNSGTSGEEEDEPIYRLTVDFPVELTLSSQIYIPASSLPAGLYKFLKSRLNFPNPKYLESQRNGYSTHAIPRYITTMEKGRDGILIPAGFLPEISVFAEKTKVKLTLNDQQAVVPVTRVKSNIKLRPEQRRATEELLAKPRSILEAGPGFGKTIVGLYCLGKLRQKTLIIVHTRELLEQWAARIHECFDLKEGDLGIIGEGKWQLGRKITLASYQTLNRRGIEGIRSTFGFIIIDECHHVPARTFTNVLKLFAAKYVLGLTATAMRRDHLDRMMEFYIGPILRVSSKSQPTGNSKLSQEPTTVTSLVVKATEFEPTGLKNSEFHEVASFLIADYKRNAMIADDITAALETGAKCLVLTERVEHCQILLDQVRRRVKGTHAAIVTGKNTRKERAGLRKRITQERFKLLISTGKLIGEGFDWPELTHLFLVFPFTYKGKVVQYVGRLQRSTTDSPQQTFV
ncbi:MAG TPA: DEAD/DEAH box helicase family protein [Candidatus Saccharimonadia bacterium]|nr:DEAD/DEAH box helicase family protein [Candidatus Saccharimonadia bacterium]